MGATTAASALFSLSIVFNCMAYSEHPRLQFPLIVTSGTKITTKQSKMEQNKKKEGEESCHAVSYATSCVQSFVLLCWCPCL